MKIDHAYKESRENKPTVLCKKIILLQLRKRKVFLIKARLYSDISYH